MQVHLHDCRALSVTLVALLLQCISLVHRIHITLLSVLSFTEPATCWMKPTAHDAQVTPLYPGWHAQEQILPMSECVPLLLQKDASQVPQLGHIPTLDVHWLHVIPLKPEAHVQLQPPVLKPPTFTARLLQWISFEHSTHTPSLLRKYILVSHSLHLDPTYPVRHSQTHRLSRA